MSVPPAATAPSPAAFTTGGGASSSSTTSTAGPLPASSSLSSYPPYGDGSVTDAAAAAAAETAIPGATAKRPTKAAVGARGSKAASAASSSSSSSSSRSTPGAPPVSSKPTTGGRDKDAFNQLLIERFSTHDSLHAAALHSAQLQMQKDFRNLHMYAEDHRKLRNEYRQWFPPRQIYGEGYVGFGNGYTETNGPSRIVYPVQKMRPGKRQTPPLKYTRKDMAQQAEQHEELVPIRLDVEWDKVKLRDTFTWNLHDRLVAPELFTSQLLEDLGLRPPLSSPVYEQVCQQIHEQLGDFYPLVYSDEDALDPELPYSAYKNDEMRILVKLNITIGQHTLVDQFEWEINNPMNSPEEFAASMARDLALSGEFTTAIAHCIREQTQLFTRGLYSVGHPFDGRPIEDPDLVAAFLPSPLAAVFRPQQQAKEYAPYLYELSEAELERNELIFSREQRRQKRSVNRRGGPILPDLKERQRTIRTLIVSSVLPGAASNVDDSRLYKRAVNPLGRRRGGRDGDVLSESEDSDDSTPGSPSLSLLAGAGTGTGTGTARTRGLRGAATVAQQRMANLGRSETPEASSVHHHETRTARRTTRDPREDSADEPPHLLVTIKVSKERLRRLMRDLKSRPVGADSTPHTPASSNHSQLPQQQQQQQQQLQQQQPPLPSQPSSQPQQQSTPHSQPQHARSASGSMGPPPTTPSSRNVLAPTRPAVPHGHLGRLPAPPPPPSEVDAPPAPPPPQWLLDALQRLRDRNYPNDSFEGVMRYSVFNKDEQLVPAPSADEPVGNYKFWYLPRIRCHDCPGKLYTPGPEMTVGNFEVHLKNRFHREKVELRLARDAEAKAAKAAKAGRSTTGFAAPAAREAVSAGATPASLSAQPLGQPSGAGPLHAPHAATAAAPAQARGAEDEGRLFGSGSRSSSSQSSTPEAG